MELDQKPSKNRIEHKYQYIVQKSKTGMKRTNWQWLESFSTLDEAFNYLKRIQLFRELEPEYFKKYKFRVSYRKSTIELTTVSPKEIMVGRIKHGV